MNQTSPKTNFSISMSPDVRQQIDDIAKADRRSVSWVVEDLCRQALDAREQAAS